MFDLGITQLEDLLKQAQKKRILKQKVEWKQRNREKVKASKQEYRKRHPNKARIYKLRAKVARKNAELTKPFIGVDGEGAGDGLSHIYWLLRVGNDALYHEDGSELDSIEILMWLADMGAANINAEFIPVSYFFDYDTTMILRHLPVKNLQELMYDKPACVRSNCHHSPSLHLNGYSRCSIDGCNCRRYIRGGETTLFLDGERYKDKPPYLRIRLQHRQLKVAWPNLPYFTVTDVADLFQTSFVKTLEKWKDGGDEEEVLVSLETLERVRANKERRSSFEIGWDQETFEYNKIECELLAALMGRFRKMCYDAGIYPDMWTGPGRLAESLFQTEGVPPRKALDIPPFIEELADVAYFGGRAEGIQFGEHDDVISYDIASAYPHAYTKMPCLLQGHGKWDDVPFEEVEENNLEHTIIVGRMIVEQELFKPNPLICGLPMRDKKGNISFPMSAYGAWWYPEVRDTILLYKKEGIKYHFHIERCFTWRQNCDDAPGNFTNKWFDKRVELGKSTRGIPIKLTLNSLYGKAAQKVGAAKWGNSVWAGLLTAYTRSRLLQATISVGSKNVISFQTDGIFVKCGDLPVGGTNGEKIKLGEWEIDRYKHLFLIQSGVYSVTDYEGKVVNKTRGMRAHEFTASYNEIKEAWDKDKWFGSFELPDRNTFVTIKLALMWGKPELAGTWIKSKRKLSFRTNMLKREIWGPDHKPTSNGITYAPGILHRKQQKVEYGAHPFNKMFEAVGIEPVYKDFSVPYSRELAIEFNKRVKDTEITYSYDTPDTPYNSED